MPKGVSSSYTSKRRSLAMKKVWQRKQHRKNVAAGQSKTFSTKAYHKKQSKAQKGRWKDETRRQKQSKALKSAWKSDHDGWADGIRNAVTPDTNARKSQSRRRLMDDPTYAQGAISKLLHKKAMSVPEKQMRTLLKLIELPYEFVGNGRLMIGRYCPDFVRVDAKSIIEVYGYHHSLEKGIAHDEVRERYIKAQGYEILVVWQKELQDLDALINKIQRFDDRVLQSTLRSSNTRTPARRQVKV